MHDKKSFVLYNSYFNQILFLDMKERGELLTAIFQYENCGEMTMQLSPLTALLFSVVKDSLDRDKEEYDRKCEANRENGKKGGRPKKSQITERFSEKPKKADNDNDIEFDNDNEFDNEIDSDSGNGNENGYDTQASGFTMPPADPVPPPPSAAPPQQQEIKNFLLNKGVDEGYIDARLERAMKFAPFKKKSVTELLLEWWRADREQTSEMPARYMPEIDNVKNKSLSHCDSNELFMKKMYQEWN